MKKLLLIFVFLFAANAYSQDKVLNVQWYCVDEAPFKKGQCDISGNEYSFVFIDSKKKEVVFFFTGMKLKYQIVSAATDAKNPDFTVYHLLDKKTPVEMRINKKQTKVEFLYSNNRIYLTTGQSTKLIK